MAIIAKKKLNKFDDKYVAKETASAERSAAVTPVKDVKIRATTYHLDMLRGKISGSTGPMRDIGSGKNFAMCVIGNNSVVSVSPKKTGEYVTGVDIAINDIDYMDPFKKAFLEGMFFTGERSNKLFVISWLNRNKDNLPDHVGDIEIGSIEDMSFSIKCLSRNKYEYNLMKIKKEAGISDIGDILSRYIDVYVDGNDDPKFRYSMSSIFSDYYSRNGVTKFSIGERNDFFALMKMNPEFYDWMYASVVKPNSESTMAHYTSSLITVIYNAATKNGAKNALDAGFDDRVLARNNKNQRGSSKNDEAAAENKPKDLLLPQEAIEGPIDPWRKYKI